MIQLFPVITHVFQNGTGAILAQFSRIVNILQMFCNGRMLRVKQQGDLFLRKA
jgi:hypothetical protein